MSGPGAIRRGGPGPGAGLGSGPTAPRPALAASEPAPGVVMASLYSPHHLPGDSSAVDDFWVGLLFAVCCCWLWWGYGDNVAVA